LKQGWRCSRWNR